MNDRKYWLTLALVLDGIGLRGRRKPCVAKPQEQERHAANSVILLNAAFMRLISAISGKVTVKVIHVSSLCAVEPFKSWGLYCTGKAGRDMLFRVLAAEYPDIRVLNYAPGPLDTNMQVEGRTLTRDEELRKLMSSMKEEGKLVPCDASAKKLLQIIQKDEFKSGEHIDFFEV
ncbi:Sepiapterin reductase [Portunus trituberculatus]|uniref:Sepiapterin reductase n=1 Tax=Portunus trituberculatus TaxID=210409 RepID=A0A5B7DFE7_PORTR|nr:Sepiapterin reductase [Portunus trituberculatus]